MNPAKGVITSEASLATISGVTNRSKNVKEKPCDKVKVTGILNTEYNDEKQTTEHCGHLFERWGHSNKALEPKA